MQPRRWSVTRRLLASYIVLLAAFAVTVGFGLRDLRRATREAELSRSALVPMQFSVGQALAEQNVLAAQLNHATAAKNPGDVRDWIETARRTRPITLASVRKAAEKLDVGIPEAARLRADVESELDTIDEHLSSDANMYVSFFDAIAGGDRARAEQLQNDAVKYEAETTGRLRSIKSKTEAAMERLGDQGRERERRAAELLLALLLLTLVVAAAITLYARRVLRPLGKVTERARSVAGGDLAPQPAVDDGTEIGELAQTFEAMVAAIRDARSELVKAERLAAIGKMAAHITHEIRNPLSAISLNLEMLEGEIETAGDAKESRELLGAIKAETNRLSRLSEQYLSLARRPVPTVATESLGELAEEVVTFLKPELTRARVEVRMDIDRAAPEVPIDDSLLRQAIVNLVRNAREAMTDGGKLGIVVRAADGGGVDLVIEDNGPGIPEDVRSSIFDPFFTTKQRGTGLGLAVTREIVEAHRGTIACEPRDEGGTRFVIHVPER